MSSCSQLCETAECWHSDCDQKVELVNAIFTVTYFGYILGIIFVLASIIVNSLMVMSLYRNVYRMMSLCEEKARISNDLLMEQRLADNLLAQLQKVAPYDAQQNEQEISMMLQSVQQKSGQNTGR